MINNKILDILVILFYNVFKTLKLKYVLNLTSSDKTYNIVLPVSSITADLTFHDLLAYISVLL